MSSDRTTEILNYLSAMSRDFGELRGEVREMRGDLQEMRTEMRNLHNEVRAIASRLDRLEARILENKADVRDLGFRVAALEGSEP